MDLIEFNNKKYFTFHTEGNMSQYTLPYAEKLCKGVGYDIGCNRKEWALPWAIPVDLLIDNEYDALNLPDEEVDFIYSSHCLEHVDNWVTTIDYWTERIKKGGTLFLYLPHYDQEYWRPWNCRKHIHCLNAETMVDYLEATGNYTNIYFTGRDLNYSFMIVAEKR